ncbi:MAG: hypothetical protein CTY31_07275 [Hyphomicrobium sp.]|nr:MAG: hypothetical protein CTY31_07275 [Hyphomicrobium sp.]
MRLGLICMVCFQESGQPDDVRYMAELQDDGSFKLKCRNGHETRIALQEQRFEYLMELAANAILDGYFREAVVSFASSLERFIEFYIRVVLKNKNVRDEVINTTWKQLSKQSERQLGAYMMLHLAERGMTAPILSNEYVKLRNEVVHKGKVASREEAIRYGNAVLITIIPTLEELKENYRDSIEAVTRNHIYTVHNAYTSGTVTSTMSYPTIVSLTRDWRVQQPDLITWLEQLEKRRAKIAW